MLRRHEDGSGRIVFILSLYVMETMKNTRKCEEKESTNCHCLPEIAKKPPQGRKTQQYNLRLAWITSRKPEVANALTHPGVIYT